MPVLSLDLIAGALSFVFTLMVLSYLIGDNPLFKVAIYLFVGVASGYVAAVVFWQVLYTKLFLPIGQVLLSGAYTQGVLLIVPFLGVVFILLKAVPGMAGVSRIAMAFLVGAGAAVTIAGALTGTLIPQVNATTNFFDLQAAAARDINMVEVAANGTVLLMGVVTSLAYFHFGANPKADGSTKRFAPINMFAWIGRFFISVTLGAVFAGVYAAALTAFIERVSSLVFFIKTLLGMP